MDSPRTSTRLLSLTDDQDLISRIEEEIARQVPVEILVTDDGLELVEEQAIRRTSVILLDVDLLQDRLQRLITILRTVDSHCKFVLLLSPENLSYCERVLPYGMVWYFFKPVSPVNAANLICSFLHAPVGK